MKPKTVEDILRLWKVDKNYPVSNYYANKIYSDVLNAELKCLDNWDIKSMLREDRLAHDLADLGWMFVASLRELADSTRDGEIIIGCAVKTLQRVAQTANKSGMSTHEAILGEALEIILQRLKAYKIEPASNKGNAKNVTKALQNYSYIPFG